MKTPPQSPSDGLASARHELPTHLQVEDRLIAGLTIRQTLLLSAGVSLGYSLWRHLAGMQLSIQTALAPTHMTGLTALLALAVRLALAALPAGAFALVALAHPADRPLEEWVVITLRYLTVPKTFIWRSGGSNWHGDLPAVAARSVAAEYGLRSYASSSNDPDDDGDDDDGSEEEPGDDLQGGDDDLLLSAMGKGGLRK